jgi:predicted dehydrogenase
MIDIGVHILETAHYMIGSPRPVYRDGQPGRSWATSPAASSVWPNWDYQTYTVEDLAAGMIRFDNGALLTIEASFVAHIEKDVWNVQSIGEKGGAELGDQPDLHRPRRLHDEHDAGLRAEVGPLRIQDEALRRGLPRRRTNEAPASTG